MTERLVKEPLADGMHALASMRLFNEMQNKICQLQPINGSLDKLLDHLYKQT